MKSDTKNIVIAVSVIITVFVAAYGCTVLYAGLSSPFYTVESGSMMHSADSKIGIIDTGDMVVVKDVSKMSITTYAEACVTGYGKFGDHGDVVLYKNAAGRTIIHRAILFMEHLGGGKWNIPDLAAYPGMWSCAKDAVGYHGILSITAGYRDIPITIDLGSPAYAGLPAGTCGYITMGDNNSSADTLFVTEDMVIAVAAHEIPWLGCVKLLITGNNADKVPWNSVIYLILSIALMIASVFAAAFTFERMRRKKE